MIKENMSTDIQVLFLNLTIGTNHFNQDNIWYMIYLIFLKTDRNRILVDRFTNYYSQGSHTFTDNILMTENQVIHCY